MGTPDTSRHDSSASTYRGFGSQSPLQRRRAGQHGGLLAQHRGAGRQWTTGEATSAGHKGSPAIRRAMQLLESEGYSCTRVTGSLAIFDVIAVSASTIRFIRVWSRLSSPTEAEREHMRRVPLPAMASRECWTFSYQGSAATIELIGASGEADE